MKIGSEDKFFEVNSQIEARYANYFKVGHNALEFLLDFGQHYSEGEPVRFHTRIVTSPGYAKALLETLGDAIERYEQTYGLISEEGLNGTLHEEGSP